jgi:serine/threonine protein kinase
MAQVGSHTNLVALVGVVSCGHPLVLVIMFCEYGSVLSELRKRAKRGSAISTDYKLQMAAEVACGMAHLGSKQFVHRDLATRNVLLCSGKSASGMVCKIADFGLSRASRTSKDAADTADANVDDANDDDDGSTEEAYYRSQNGVFPVKWTAPEAMETLRFTVASDIWSFGIVVIELFQNGLAPYSGRTNPEVMTMVMSGARHSKPSACPDWLFDTVLQCWDIEPSKRPTFLQVEHSILEASVQRGFTRTDGSGTEDDSSSTITSDGTLHSFIQSSNLSHYEYSEQSTEGTNSISTDVTLPPGPRSHLSTLDESVLLSHDHQDEYDSDLPLREIGALNGSPHRAPHLAAMNTTTLQVLNSTILGHRRSISEETEI